MAYRQAQISGARKSGVGIKFTVDVQAMSKEVDRVIHQLADVDIPKGLGIGLRDFAELVAQDIRDNAPAEHLRKNVSVEKVQVGNAGEYTVAIKVNTLDARAWEFGSGIHATKGTAKTYVIRPKDAPMLSFYWKNRGKWFVGTRVNHPGIEAHPYVAPAVKRQLRHINKLVVEGVRRRA